MRSAYDRAGETRGRTPAISCYRLADDFNVTLDVEGAGILYFTLTTTGTAAPGITSRDEWGTDTVRLPAAGDGPHANPDDLAEYEFAAAAGQPFTIWVRGKDLEGENASDAFWMQFDDEIGTTRIAPSYAHPKGLGN